MPTLVGRNHTEFSTGLQDHFCRCGGSSERSQTGLLVEFPHFVILKWEVKRIGKINAQIPGVGRLVKLG